MEIAQEDRKMHYLGCKEVKLLLSPNQVQQVEAMLKSFERDLEVTSATQLFR
jgi:hypothetical protein